MIDIPKSKTYPTVGGAKPSGTLTQGPSPKPASTMTGTPPAKSSLEVKKAQDLKVGENYVFRALVYGRTGTGKTRAIASLPKPVFIIDTDNGMLSNRGESGLDYVEIPFDRGIGLPEAYKMAEDAVDYLVKNRGDYRSIVLDGLSTLSKGALAKVVFLNRHQGQAATLPDYNMEKMQVEGMLTKLLGTGKHLYITAHEEFTRNEVSGQSWCLPVIRGNLQPIVGMWFDEVYHARVKKDAAGKYNYVWLVRADVMYSAKSRMAKSVDIEGEQPQHFVEYAKRCGVELK